MNKRGFIFFLLLFFLSQSCYADLNDYLDYVAKNRNHFGVKFDNAFLDGSRFFAGVDASDIGASAKVCVEQAGFLGKDITAGLEAQSALLDDKRYKQATEATAVYIYAQMDEYTKFSTELRYSQPEIYHLADTADAAIRRYSGENQVSTLLLRCENYPVDNEEYSTTGRKSDVSFEVSSKVIGSDFNFLRTTAGNAFYYTPAKGIFKEGFLKSITFVASGQAAWMRKFGSEDEIPFFERLYVGGTGTVRGYKPRYLAPRDSDDRPIGGNCMAVLTAEMRYPVYKDIKGAIFYDQGNAWKHADDFDLTDTKAGVGTGLRWVTPLGTARLDYGYGLNGNTRQRGGRVHLSLGMKF